MKVDRLGSSVDILDLLDTSSIQIPARSTLYHLKPIGIGTEFTECFTSYLSRLAQAHNVLLGELIQKELQSHLPRGYREQGLRGSHIYMCARTLIGLGVMAKDWVRMLEALTLRSDLKLLTMISWKEVFPTQGLLKFKRAWCSRCYEEWQVHDQIMYDPLIWAINEVKICMRHLRELSSACPHCGESLPHLDRKYRPGHCSKCLGWLGFISSEKYESHAELGGDEFEWQVWVATNIGDLLAVSSRLSSPLRASRIAKMLSTYIKRYHEGDYCAFARWLEMHNRNILTWCKGKKVPQLPTLLYICYRLNLSLVEFFTGSDIFKNLAPLTGKTKVWDRKGQGKQRVDRDKIRCNLESILSSDKYPPPSMKEASKQFELSYRRLYYIFPELCREISAKHAAYRQECKLKNINRACEDVTELVLKLHAEGLEPNQGMVARLMNKAAYIREEKVWTTYLELRQKLGYDNSRFRKR